MEKVPAQPPTPENPDLDSIVHAAEDIAGLLSGADSEAQRGDLVKALDTTLHEAQVAVVDLNAASVDDSHLKRGRRTGRTREQVIEDSQQEFIKLGRAVLINTNANGKWRRLKRSK